MEEKVIREYIQVSGAVQGVGFRYRAEKAAGMFGITGWVSNLWNGDVELEVQGKKSEIDQMLEAIARGRFVRIDDLRRREIPTEKEEYGFHIR